MYCELCVLCVLCASESYHLIARWENKTHYIIIIMYCEECENRVKWHWHQYQTQSNTVMAQLIGAVTSVTSNFLEINQVSIDNWGFKLFYKATTTYLILSSVLATAKQFFGSPIQCDAGSVSQNFKKYYDTNIIHFRPKMVLRRKCWSPTAGCTPLGTFPGNTKVLAQVVTRWDTST